MFIVFQSPLEMMLMLERKTTRATRSAAVPDKFALSWNKNAINLLVQVYRAVSSQCAEVTSFLVCLLWPWTHWTDVPMDHYRRRIQILTDGTLDRVNQSHHRSILKLPRSDNIRKFLIIFIVTLYSFTLFSISDDF